MTNSNQQHKFSDFLKLSDNGYLLLDEHGCIVHLNDHAGRILRIDPEAEIGNKLNSLNLEGTSWRGVLEACEQGQPNDLTVILSGGHRVMVSLRRQPHSQNIELLQFCDMEAFDYRRDRASGIQRAAVSNFLAGNRTRPDFEVQRRLSPELHRVLSRGERAIRQGARVLITGETGVGKSEVARFLHKTVANAADPFVIVNCVVSSPTELSDILFGDGVQNEGLIHRAMGGTLFLDEVAEIPMSVQARLLGFLEDFAVGSTGVNSTMAPNVRIISATNANLQTRINDGLFRSDLYYRIAVIGLSIPPLRQMPSLISHLTDRFLLTINHRRSTPVILPTRFRNVLGDYSFPGNIRELLNIVQKASIFMEDAEDMEELIAELIAPGPQLQRNNLTSSTTLDLKTEVRRFERALIDKVIRIHGSKRKAAKVLGVDIGTIVRKTVAKAADDISKKIDNKKYSQQQGVRK